MMPEGFGLGFFTGAIVMFVLMMLADLLGNIIDGAKKQ